MIECLALCLHALSSSPPHWLPFYSRSSDFLILFIISLLLSWVWLGVISSNSSPKLGNPPLQNWVVTHQITLNLYFVAHQKGCGMHMDVASGWRQIWEDVAWLLMVLGCNLSAWGPSLHLLLLSGSKLVKSTFSCGIRPEQSCSKLFDLWQIVCTQTTERINFGFLQF